MPIVSILNLKKKNESHLELTIGNDHSLYEELEAQGKILPHGCLSGSCGACRIEILQGQENLSLPSIIEQDTIDHLNNYKDKTIRLACRAKLLKGFLQFSIIK